MSRDSLSNGILHYRPWWFAFMLPVLSFLIQIIAADEARPANIHYTAELTLAMLAFWIWAMTTNWHTRVLVAKSGRESGTDRELELEAVVIVFLAALTVVIYLSCFTHMPDALKAIGTFAAIGMPILVLGLP